jgi:hypothetical protein
MIYGVVAMRRVAEEHRAIRETNMNQFSSRSHSIFQVHISPYALYIHNSVIAMPLSS